MISPPWPSEVSTPLVSKLLLLAQSCAAWQLASVSQSRTCLIATTTSSISVAASVRAAILAFLLAARLSCRRLAFSKAPLLRNALSAALIAFLSAIFQVAFILAIADEQLSLRESLKKAFHRFWSYLFLSFLTS